MSRMFFNGVLDEEDYIKPPDLLLRKGSEDMQDEKVSVWIEIL